MNYKLKHYLMPIRYFYKPGMKTYNIGLFYYFWIEFNRYGLVFGISKSHKPVSLWLRKIEISFEWPIIAKVHKND